MVIVVIIATIIVININIVFIIIVNVIIIIIIFNAIVAVIIIFPGSGMMITSFIIFIMIVIVVITIIDQITSKSFASPFANWGALIKPSSNSAFDNYDEDDHHGWLTRKRQKLTCRISPLGADIS